MVTELIIKVIGGFVEFLGSLFPTMDQPGFVTDVAGYLSTIATTMAPLGHWLPFGPMAVAFLFAMASVGIAMAVRITRIIASFLTAGGGSAG